MSILVRLRVFAACAWALGAVPAHSQDDNGAPPPTDNGAPSTQDNGSQPDAQQPPPGDGNVAQDPGITFQNFYDALSSQGTWVQSSQYGYVWQPSVMDPDWAPYTEGNWVYTDAGWTWVSDEPWGWATYHYGRWVNLDGSGWCWVPGYTWAPAWVSWRYGNGYAGWAPLPPDSFVGVDYTDDGFAIGVGFHIGGDCDNFYGIGPGWYVFLPATCLGYHSYHGYYYHRGDNYAIINRTTNVTNINVTGVGASGAAGSFHHHATTGGPMLEQVNAVATIPVQRVNLVRTGHAGGGGTLKGNSLALYAPRVVTGTTAQPARVAGTIRSASINRGTDIMQPLAVNSFLSGQAATDAQVQQARIAQAHAPPGAKVMTDATTVQPVLSSPLTSMKPVAGEAAPARFIPTTTVISNPQRAPSVYGNSPGVRTFPETGEPAGAAPRVDYQGPVTSPGAPQFQTHPVTTISPGAPAQTYARPTAPAAASSPPAVRQTTGGTSGAGYANGGAGHGQSSGGGSSSNGGYHGGAGSSQSH